MNKFPEMVTSVVQRLKLLCSSMGKTQIAQTLARAGLHLGVSTVGRRLKAKPTPAPQPIPAAQPGPNEKPAGRVVTAKRPDHVWHVELTPVPTTSGFWVPWVPNALPQCWPFCWWVALAVDHFSRRVMGFAVYRREPSSAVVRGFLEGVFQRVDQLPRHLISDQGIQFTAKGFRRWCHRLEIQHRFGAVEKYGNLAVIERCIRTLKAECAGRLILVPFRLPAFRNELILYCSWYNIHRPHTRLRGATPDEIFHGSEVVNWSRGSAKSRPS